MRHNTLFVRYQTTQNGWSGLKQIMVLYSHFQSTNKMHHSTTARFMSFITLPADNDLTKWIHFPLQLFALIANKTAWKTHIFLSPIKAVCSLYAHNLDTGPEPVRIRTMQDNVLLLHTNLSDYPVLLYRPILAAEQFCMRFGIYTHTHTRFCPVQGDVFAVPRSGCVLYNQAICSALETCEPTHLRARKP